MFSVGDMVYARNFSSGPTLLEGRVLEVRGPLSFRIELGGGRIVWHHIDQIRANTAVYRVYPSAMPGEADMDAADTLPSRTVEDDELLDLPDTAPVQDTARYGTSLFGASMTPARSRSSRVTLLNPRPGERSAVL